MKLRKRYQHADIRLTTCLGLAAAIIIAGTLGYHWLERWSWIDSFYMTIITISTVGLGEVHALSPAGRVFTTVLIVLGVGTMAAALSIVFEMLFQRQIRIAKEKRSMRKLINQLQKHTIVCGFGRMGGVIASSLIQAGQDVVIIESDEKKSEMAESENFPVVLGSATDETTLSSAGIERAASLIAALSNDADNVFLTLTARGLNQELNIIARAEDDRNNRKFTLAGANRVVSPLSIGANHIVRLLTRPSVVDFVELVSKQADVKFEVIESKIDADSPCAAKPLSESGIREHLGGMVIAIRKANGQLVFDPKPHTMLEIGDTLFVIGSPDQHPADN